MSVARWSEGDLGAILSVTYDEDDPEEPFSQLIDTYECIEGRWVERGSSGSDWPVSVWGDRPGGARLTNFFAGFGGSWWMTSGIAHVGAEHVLIVIGGTEQIVPIEPVTGAFLVRVPDRRRTCDAIDALPSPT